MIGAGKWIVGYDGTRKVSGENKEGKRDDRR